MDPIPFIAYDTRIPSLPMPRGIAVFRFQDLKYGEIAFHAYKHYQIMIILNGSVNILTEDNSYPVHPGSVIIHPPGLWHTTEIPPQTRSYHRFVIHVEKRVYDDALARFALGDTNLPFHGEEILIYDFDYIDLPPLVTAVEAIYTHTTHNDAFTDAGIRNMLAEIFLQMERDSLKHKAESKMRTNSAALRAVHIIEKEFKDSLLSLESIANRLYVNKSYLARIFKDHFGETIYQSILDKRLRFAVECMGRGCSVKQAYLEAGFKDYSAFLKAFKKKYNMLPTEFIREVAPEN